MGLRCGSARRCAREHRDWLVMDRSISCAMSLVGCLSRALVDARSHGSDAPPKGTALDGLDAAIVICLTLV